jgi:hypothetical protein
MADVGNLRAKLGVTLCIFHNGSCHTPIKGQYRVHTSYVRPRNSRTHKPTN